MVMATIAQMRAAARPGLDDITERGFEFDEVKSNTQNLWWQFSQSSNQKFQELFLTSG